MIASTSWAQRVSVHCRQGTDHSWRKARFAVLCKEQSFSLRFDRHGSRPGPLTSNAMRDCGTFAVESCESDLNSDICPDEQWMNSPEALVERLESGDVSLYQKAQAALLAETIPFRAELSSRLLNGLFKFANEHRFSENEQTLVAVGAAIRKFAMNMPCKMLEQFAMLFVPSETQTVSCHIELELAKGASWRLAMLPESECKQAFQLEYRLTELATDYLSTRLLLQENYAAIALNALLAVVLLNGEKQQELITRIGSLRAGQHHMTWFRELFADRLMEAARKQTMVDAARAERMAGLACQLDANLR